MNEDRRPASGETAADTSPSVDEAKGAETPTASDGAPEGEGGAPGGGPESPASGSAAGTGDGTEPSAAGSATEPEAAGESGPEAGGEPGPEAEGEPAEAPAGEPEEPAEAAETVASLRTRLDVAFAEAQGERDAALRARAEVENVRRRAERDVEQAHRFGIEGLVRELLPVRDGLELGIRAAGEEGSTVEALAEGTEMTLRMLSAALEKFGAVEVDPGGEDFDPRFHEAMTMQQAEGVEPGKVLQVFQKGCLLHGRVVRPAKVIVSR